MAKVLRRFNSDLVVCEMQFGYKKTVIIGKIRGGKEAKGCQEDTLSCEHRLPRSSAITEDYRTSFQQVVTRPLQCTLYDIKRKH